MKNVDRHTFPLQELVGKLNANGYVTTIEQILQIQTLLLSSPLAKLSTSELKFVITPVIAKNAEEQGEVYNIIDSWVAERTEVKQAPPTRWQRWLNEHRTLLFASKLLVVLLVPALAVWLYLRTTGEKGAAPKKALKEQVTADKNAQDFKDVGTVPPVPSGPAASSSKSARQPASDTSLAVNYVTDLQNPIARAVVDNRLPLSLAFGFVMGAVLFHFISYEQRKRMELDKRKRTEDALFTLPGKESSDNFVYLYNEVQPLKQMDLRFSSKEYLIHRPVILQKIKLMLQQPAFVEDPPINIRASIRKSILAAGMATIVSESEWRDRKILLICERYDPDAHITCLLEYIVKYIKAANPNISKYYYSGDVMELRDISDRPVPLQQLAYLFPGHHMIVIGNCQAFFDTETLRIKETVVEQFSQWESRSVITPLALPDWSTNESQLQDAGFEIVPADIEAIELLVSGIVSNTPVRKDQLLRAATGTASVAQYDWRYVDQWKDYLKDEQLFQAVCALAVYPFLRWPVTLALFHAFEKACPGFVLDYNRLLKLCRIPWINHGHIDQQVRLQMLAALELKNELLARETVLKLLDETKLHTEQGTNAYTELQVQYNINAFFLYSQDQLQYKQYAGVKEVIAYYWNDLDDWALKEHMKHRQSGMVPGSQAMVPSSVEEFVVREQVYEKLNFRVKQSAVLVLPSALLYIIFSITKPQLVYMEDITQKINMAVVVKKEGLCKGYLAAITVSNGILSTSQPLSDKPSDTIRMKDIPFNSFVHVQLTTGNGMQYTASIPATHEVCNLNTSCNKR